MTSVRVAAAAVAVSSALVLQMSVFSHFSWNGVVPNLVLLVVYVAGRVSQDTRFDAKPTAVVVVATVGASSFLGTSVFALSGVLLRDPPLAVPDLLQVIVVAVIWDVLLTPVVLPAVMAMFARLEPEHAT